MSRYYDEELLVHSGTEGMHWGIRRWQNYDGSLTEAGKVHYGRVAAKYEAKSNKARNSAARHRHNAKKLRSTIPPANLSARHEEAKAKANSRQAAKWTRARNKLVKDLSKSDINRGREAYELNQAFIKDAASIPVSMLKYWVVGTPMYFIDAGKQYLDDRKEIKEKYA